MWHMRRRIHVWHMRRRIHVWHMRKRIHVPCPYVVTKGYGLRLAAKDGVEVTESSINQQQTPSQYC